MKNSPPLAAAVLLAMIGSGCAPSRPPDPPAAAPDPAIEAAAPVIDDAFWKTWGDGQAELAGYHLIYPRYGQPRAGTAVTIFVTEPFAASLRVKADPGNHPGPAQFPAMKLNLIKDFQTGIYDYNELTSSFVALRAVHGRPAGWLTKVSFSSQEWCGHVWQQLLFDAGGIRSTLHSYFDGEADQSTTLPHPAAAFSEDQLLLWARGMAWPVLAPGESKTVAFLPSLEDSRHSHQPLEWSGATLSRSASTTWVDVPAGRFEVETFRAAVANRGERTVYIEKEGARRVVRWETSAGERADLLGATRMKYWENSGLGGEKLLESLGLRARPPRTP